MIPRVLITGATRGIGRAIAEALAPDHHLLIGGRERTAVEEVCRSLPSATPFVADLLDEESTAAAAAEVGALDAVVHSAGIAGGGPLASLTRQQWRNMFELNVIAVADLTRLLLPALTQARGTVVVINSGSGYRATGLGGMYPASKFAARALTDVMREELRPQGIRVSSIHPGRVDTDMQRELVASENRPYDASEFLRPASVAAAVHLALTATDDATIEELSIRPAPRMTGN